MITANLRRSGGSLTVTIPAAYRKQHGLAEGDRVQVQVDGETLRIRPAEKPKITLQAIIDAAPDDIHGVRAETWDAMPPAGKEW